jgi:hypothetical protein
MCTKNIAKVKNSLKESSQTLFSAPDEVIVALNEELNQMQKYLYPNISKMKNYLGDKHTQITLIRIIRNAILNQFMNVVEVAQKSRSSGINFESEQNIAAVIDAAFESCMN